MSARYSDAEIACLISEAKPLPANFRARLQLREKRGHRERELDLTGSHGSQFRLILRQSDFNAMDFSIILAVSPANSNQLFRLRRYNGKSHEHTNHLEHVTFYDFHIHYATERYQDSGAREDAYAEPTNRYADFHEALSCMLTDCNFEAPQVPQQDLFGEFEV